MTAARKDAAARRPLHAVRIDARTIRYSSADRGVVAEWRYWCVCGAEGQWMASLAQATRDSEVHLAMRPATPDDLT